MSFLKVIKSCSLMPGHAATDACANALQSPRFAQRLGAKTIGLFVGDEFVLLEVVVSPCGPGRGRCSRRGKRCGPGRPSRHCPWLAAGLDAVQEIADVERGRVAARSQGSCGRRATPASSTPFCRCRPSRPSRFRLRTERDTNRAESNRFRGRSAPRRWVTCDDLAVLRRVVLDRRRTIVPTAHWQRSTQCEPHSSTPPPTSPPPFSN